MAEAEEPLEGSAGPPCIQGELRELLVAGADQLGLNLGEPEVSRLLEYLDRVLALNQSLNLTAVREPAEATVKHLVDSLSLLRALPDVPQLSLIDVGSGAGFPAVPVHIVRPGWSITLLDARQKRVNAVRGFLEAMGLLDGVTLVADRAEIAGQRWEYRHKFDVAVARAVAPLDVLAEYCLPFVKVGGLFIAMKGPGVEEECANAKPALKALGGKVVRVESLELPFNAGGRSLIAVSKQRLTPSQYPRRPGEPERHPLSKAAPRRR
ncbi:MAG TPA: 16S rRNA (guanine(527)-N(7))-methyltransferase RsmG [Armatimonadota bacterium]|jgi:16S rRNA (guanine527-N7)-methyltransferase